MLITDVNEIKKYMTGFVPFRFKDGAYELTVGTVFHPNCMPELIDYKGGPGLKLTYNEDPSPELGYTVLMPQEHCIVKSVEKLNLPADVHAVGYALRGLSHAGVGLVGNPLFHLGYSGIPELAFHNHNVRAAYKLYREQPVIQLQFFKSTT